VRGRATKAALVVIAPWAFGCALFGTRGLDDVDPLPVFLPGERVECLFEVIGEVTVAGPFPPGDAENGGSRQVVMERIRLEVGREAAGSGAHAVMVREVRYKPGGGAEIHAPEIVAVDGMLLSFVDPACVPVSTGTN
jgi:hypothetical protein